MTFPAATQASFQKKNSGKTNTNTARKILLYPNSRPSLVYFCNSATLQHRFSECVRPRVKGRYLQLAGSQLPLATGKCFRLRCLPELDTTTSAFLVLPSSVSIVAALSLLDWSPSMEHLQICSCVPDARNFATRAYGARRCMWVGTLSSCSVRGCYTQSCWFVGEGRQARGRAPRWWPDRQKIQSCWCFRHCTAIRLGCQLRGA